METSIKNMTYPITIPIPYSTTLIGVLNSDLTSTYEVIRKKTYVPVKEYNMSKIILTLIKLAEISNDELPYIKENDGTIIASLNIDKAFDKEIKTLIKSFIDYENCNTNTCVKGEITTLIPLMSTRHIIDTICYITEYMENSRKRIIDEYDLKRMNQEIIALKTELSIREAYTFPMSAMLEYAPTIKEYNREREMIINKYLESHRELCKYHTICIKNEKNINNITI